MRMTDEDYISSVKSEEAMRALEDWCASAKASAKENFDAAILAAPFCKTYGPPPPAVLAAGMWNALKQDGEFDEDTIIRCIKAFLRGYYLCEMIEREWRRVRGVQ